MKEQNKRIIESIIVIFLISSLAGNIYWFGNKRIENERIKAFELGTNQVLNAIENSLKQSGQVIFTTQEGSQVILVPLIPNENEEKD